MQGKGRTAKFVSILLCCVLVLALAGCGKTADSGNKPANTPATSADNGQAPARKRRRMKAGVK